MTAFFRADGWVGDRRAGLIAEDELFHAHRNAKVVKASAEYYRLMFAGRVSSWNLRDPLRPERPWRT